MKYVLSVFLLLCCCPAFCQSGQYLTGGAILPKCKVFLASLDGQNITASQENEAQECVGYLEGTFDTEAVIRATKGNDAPHNVCQPSEMTLGQLVRVFVKYSDAHPEMLHLPGALLLHNALVLSFPCPKS